MLVEYILNNYQIGAKLRSAPQDKIVKVERIDGKRAVYLFEVNAREKEFLDLLFAKKGQIL